MAFIGDVLMMVVNIYFWIVIMHVVVSWLIAFDILNVRNSKAQRLVEALSRAVEPVLAPIRRVIPPIAGIDISPIVLIIAIQIVQRAIIHIFYL